MRIKSVFALSAALAVFVAITPLKALGDYVPAGFAAYTEDLQQEGYVNGQMDRDRMMTTRGCLLERDAAYTFSKMMEAADRDGVRLGTDDCYRTFWTQKASWERRCPFTQVAVRVTDPDSGVVGTGFRTYRVCSGPPTARAGESNHGWGRAIDFTDGRGVLTCRDRAFQWLQANAYKYGWVHPPWAQCRMPTEEAWHWEWAGVVDENLVPGYSSIWIFDDITLARLGSDLDYSAPLPPAGLADDQEFFERWRDLGHWGLSDLPDQ